MKTTKKIKLNLAKLNGNAFAMIGAFSAQAKREGWSKDEINEVITECQSGDYDNLLRVLIRHTR